MESFLQKLPVDALWGVGPVTARRRRGAGVEKLVDVRTVDDETLHGLVGRQADWLKRLAQGIDERPVVSDRERKSRSSEHTYAEDLREIDRIRAEIDRMAAGAADWLQRAELAARTVTLKVRYDDFKTVTRSDTRAVATVDAADITRRARALLDRTDAGRRPVRLLGVGVHGLRPRSATENAREPLLWDAAPGA